jgi:hypothetical protein
MNDRERERERERDKERNNWGERETMTVERENSVGHLRSWHGLF